MAHGEFVHLEHVENKNEVRNVTIILTVLTLIELGLGFLMMDMANGSVAKLATKIAIVILMLMKAYYIVGYFMHLKHEVRNLIMTIVVPLVLFVWFILAFLMDGESYRNLKNTYDPHHAEQSQKKVSSSSSHNNNTHQAKPAEKEVHH